MVNDNLIRDPYYFVFTYVISSISLILEAGGKALHYTDE